MSFPISHVESKANKRNMQVKSQGSLSVFFFSAERDLDTMEYPQNNVSFPNGNVSLSQQHKIHLANHHTKVNQNTTNLRISRGKDDTQNNDKKDACGIIRLFNFTQMDRNLPTRSSVRQRFFLQGGFANGRRIIRVWPRTMFHHLKSFATSRKRHRRH